MNHKLVPTLLTMSAAMGVFLSLTVHATLTVTNGTFGTVNRNGQYVDGGGWFESTPTVNWVEGSWANPGTYPVTFPGGSGMACLFDGAQANAYIYQKLGTVDAADLAAGSLRISSDFAEKSDDTTVDGAFTVYAGTFTGAHGTDIASGGLTQLFTTNMDAAAQGLTAASGNNSRVTAKWVGDVSLAGTSLDTEIWLRIGRPSSGAGDFLVDNVAVQLVTNGAPMNVGYWNGLGGGTLSNSSLSFCTNAYNQPLDASASLATLASLSSNAFFADVYYDNSIATPVTTTNITVAAGGISIGAITFQNSSALTYTLDSADAAGIAGATSVTKTGLGTVVFNGANTYTGGTVVSQGTLRINGSLAAGSPMNVTANGTLAGSGTIGGAATIAGMLTPGTSLGTISFGGSLALSGNVLIEVNKALSPSNDVINVAGALNYGGTLTVTNSGAIPFAAGDTFQIFPAGGSGTLTVAGTPGAGLAWSFSAANGALSVVASSLVWQGDGASNVWNVAGATNWSKFGAPIVFNQGDSVVFDDSGSATPPVNITASVIPASLLVSNVTRDYTFGGAGMISGGATLVKMGSGTLTLQTANDNTGGEIVSGGTLRVSGGTVGTGAMLVNAGGSVSGSGSHRGPVMVNGSISTGDSAGTLTTGAQTWNSGGVCVLEIQSATNSAAQDFLNLTGPLNVQATPSSPFVLKLVSLASNGSPGPVADFDPAQSYTWWVANPFGGVTNWAAGDVQLDTSAFSNPLAGGQFSVAVAGNSLVIQFTPATPPPSLAGQAGVGGSFQLTATSTPGQYQVFLAASNLVPPVVWVPVATNFVGSNGLATFNVTPSAGVPQRYYRASVLAPEVITVTNFGIQPNTLADATVPVQQAIAAIAQRAGRPVILRFPNGRYDFYPTNAARVLYYISNTASEGENPDPTKTIGLWLKGLTNVVVDGEGSLLMFHGKMTTFVVDQCQDLEIRNVREDFARPTMSEVKVTAVSGNTMDVDVHPDSTYSISGGHLTWVGEGWTSSNSSMTQEFAPETDTTWRNGWNPVSSASSVQELAPFKLRLNYGSTPSATVGHWYQMRETIRDQVGVFIHKSRNITLRNSGFHYTHGLGIVGQYTENLTLDTVMMEPRPESGRTCSAFADFFQVSGCRGKVNVWNCRFVGAHDDPINTHGTHLRIVAQPATNQVQVRFMHAQSYGFDAFFPGDQVDFVHKTTLTVYGTRQVQAVQRIDARNILLTLDQDVPAGLVLNSDCVENATWTPELEVRGCWFSRYPTRGILVTTRRPVVIERNVFNRSPMPGILIANDAASWYESGMVANVLIRENQFINCSSPVIQLAPENSTVDINNPVHSNVCIQQNLFRHTGSQLLSAKSTELVRFEANRIQRTPVGSASSLISFNACRNSTVTNNVMEPY